ncbi:MAG TPA: short-chain fatty acid transporter [Hyphomonadaceae bacterium]|nr:short-chain fatty acid transporter [Hyphomonadaceae bacterium]
MTTRASTRTPNFNFTAACVRIAERWMPDAFVIALALTALTFVLCVGLAGLSPTQTLKAWGGGFWNLLQFTNQIVMTLLLGYALAHTPPVMRALTWIAGLPRNAGHAYLLVGFISCIASIFSWALCLVAGAIMATRTARACAARGVKVHYPLLVATGFSGMCVWHQGLSSSIGLSVATPGHFLESAIGVIPTSATIFAPWNLAIVAMIVLIVPFGMRLLAPPAAEARALDATAATIAVEPEEPLAKLPQAIRPAEHLENSRLLMALAVAAGLFVLIDHFVLQRKGLDLNSLNFAFLVLGMACAGRPSLYLRLIMDAARVSAPFLLQYPFYAGLAAMMALNGGEDQPGLAQMMINMFIAISNAETLPLFTFLSGGLLNMFVPSGGGQWAIQGPIAMEAAIALGADVPKTAMAVAMGDQWTNLIQPLNALPALAVAGLHIRDIMGYCLIAVLFTGVIFAIGLIFIF